MNRDNGHITIPPELKDYLSTILKRYKGSKKIKGYGALIKMINGVVSTEYAEYIKHTLENETGSIYSLLGGDRVLSYLDKKLQSITNSNEAIKDAKQRAGMRNSHIKAHKKNSNNSINENKIVRVFLKENDFKNWFLH